jgi:hypothetical protein
VNRWEGSRTVAVPAFPGSRNRERSLGWFLAVLLLGGCASTLIVERSVVSEKVGQAPPIGSPASTPVGGTVFSQFRYWSRVAYRLDAPVHSSFMVGQVAAAQGEVLVKAVVDGKDVLCTERRTYSDPVLGPHRATCFIESAGTRTFTRMTVPTGGVALEKDLASPVAYSTFEQIVSRAEAFKYELLYEGISGKTIRLSYREFRGDLALPAESQDLLYDIDALPVTLTFKAVRLEVLGADNNALTYRVLSGF